MGYGVNNVDEKSKFPQVFSKPAQSFPPKRADIAGSLLCTEKKLVAHTIVIILIVNGESAVSTFLLWSYFCGVSAGQRDTHCCVFFNHFTPVTSLGGSHRHFSYGLGLGFVPSIVKNAIM